VAQTKVLSILMFEDHPIVRVQLAEVTRLRSERHPHRSEE